MICVPRSKLLGFENVHWMERRQYHLNCNWKVFVDNYLDGGYHVPHLHKGLDSVLDYAGYTIETAKHFCLQSSPIVSTGGTDERGRRPNRFACVLLLALSQLHDELL